MDGDGEELGAKEILLVCKHVGGFCWWPTETSDYCVKNIPWKDGKGNLVKEVAAACRRHGFKMGIYIYSDDPRFAKEIGRGGRTDDPSKQQQWNRLLRKQWEEVLALCGKDLVNEIWFDGSCVRAAGRHHHTASASCSDSAIPDDRHPLGRQRTRHRGRSQLEHPTSR